MARRKINIRRYLPLAGLSVVLVSLGVYIYTNSGTPENNEVIKAQITAYEPLSGRMHKSVNSSIDLSTPTKLTVESIEEGIKLSWEEIADALGYEVEINGQVVAEVFESYYVQEEIDESMSYTYRVRSKCFEEVGEWSDPLQVVVDENKAIESEEFVVIYNYVMTYGNQIVLRWEAEEGTATLELDGQKVNNFTFKDGFYTYIHKNVTPGSLHTYLIQSGEEIKQTVKATTKEMVMGSESNQLTLDGKSNDWSQESLVYEMAGKRLYSAQSETQIALAVSGVSTEDACFFLDMDVDGTTGYQSGGFAFGGADVLIDGESIYTYVGNGNDWKWQEVGTAKQQISHEGMEVIIDKASINASGIRPYGLGYNDAQEVLMPKADQTMQIVYTSFTPEGTWTNKQVESKCGTASVLVNFDEVLFATGYEVSLDGTVLAKVAQNSYCIRNLTPGTTYEVKVRPVMDHMKGSWSKPLTVSIQPEIEVSGYIQIDGELGDWDNIPISCQTDTITVKTAQDEESLYVCILGEGKETQIFIDGDQEATTGYKIEAFMGNGADYIIDGTSVYSYTGDGETWEWHYLGEAESSIALLEETSEVPNYVEMIISKEMLGITKQFEMGINIGESTYLSQDEEKMFTPTVQLDFDPTLLKAPTVARSLGTIQTVSLILQGSAQHYIVEFNGVPYQVGPDEEGNVRLSLRNLTPGTTYNYRVCSVKGNKQGAWSQMQSVSTRDYRLVPTGAIVIDTNKSDWLGMTPLMTNKTGDGILYFALDDTNLYFLIQEHIGFKTETIFIDTDPLAGTGYAGSEWVGAGIDYMIEMGTLYRYAGDGQSWSWDKLNNVTNFFDADGTIEGYLPLKQIGLEGRSEIWIGLEGPNQVILPQAQEQLFVVSEVLTSQ